VTRGCEFLCGIRGEGRRLSVGIQGTSQWDIGGGSIFGRPRVGFSSPKLSDHALILHVSIMPVFPVCVPARMPF